MRSDCVHEQVAKRIANVRFTVDKQTAKTQSLYHKYSAEKKEMSHETVVYLFFLSSQAAKQLLGYEIS